jgi:hypothetical protein
MLIGLVAAVLVPARPAVAHPLGNFSINHYNRIEVGPSSLRVRYVVDLAEIPTFQLKQRIDTDGDSRVQATEQSAFARVRMAELAVGLSLTIDGAPVSLGVDSKPFA